MTTKECTCPAKDMPFGQCCMVDLVARMRDFEITHKPDGLPAVKMRDISALCDEVQILRAERDIAMAAADRLKAALNDWFAKTEWVQESARPKELGMHRADVLRSRLAASQADAARLRGALEVILRDYRAVHDIGDLEMQPALFQASAAIKGGT